MALSPEEKKAIAKWEALHRISQSTDYTEYLKPILVEAFTNKWPDPAQDGFGVKYQVEYGKMMAFKEIYNLLANAATTIEGIRKQSEKRQSGGI